MRYYLDCEFDGLGGPLMSMALVSETGKSMYVVMNYGVPRDEWVLKNVHSVMLDFPVDDPYPCIFGADEAQLSAALEVFFKADIAPYVIADWPDDIRYLCAALITGPGTMINVPGIKFCVKRVDAYPTTLKGAVQHNAWWDAMALRQYLIENDAGSPDAIREAMRKPINFLGTGEPS